MENKILYPFQVTTAKAPDPAEAVRHVPPVDDCPQHRGGPQPVQAADAPAGELQDRPAATRAASPTTVWDWEQGPAGFPGPGGELGGGVELSAGQHAELLPDLGANLTANAHLANHQHDVESGIAAFVVHFLFQSASFRWHILIA